MEIILKGQEYLLMIVFVFTSVGLIKEYQLFNSMFYYLKQVVHNNKILVVLLSALGGILPISGRVTVSAGMLDTIAPPRGAPGRAKYGIIDYLSTHHYYLWSPLEKTILIPMAAFGLSYIGILTLLWPLLAVSIGIIAIYIWFMVKASDVVITPILDFQFKISEIVRNVVPMIAAVIAIVHAVNPAWAFGLLTLYYCLICKEWQIKKILGYVHWDVIVIVAAIIVFGNWVKTYDAVVTDYLKNLGFDITTSKGFIAVSMIAIGSGWIFGSSSKFAAFSVILTKLFGMQYFVWFFALEYAGYLLSPAHKCLAIGKSYFGTSLKDYVLILGIWAFCLITVGAVQLAYVHVS
jgi:hypothetical protein